MPENPAEANRCCSPMLHAENLALSLPLHPPLRVPRLIVRTSGFVAILAEKRTTPPTLQRALLETLAGDRPAETGRVLFLDQDLGQASPGWATEHGLSLLLSKGGCDPTSSVEANLLGSTGSSLPAWLFRFLPLEAHLSVQAGRLSSIEQRWLALACALAPRPRLLLLERPFEALPPLPREALLERILRINLEEGIAFCFTAEPSPVIQTAAASTYRIADNLLVSA
ncbi:MAG: hypothetical protein AB7T14_03795 [Candidatus Methylacidiphilaceae bacterium]